MTKLTEKQLRDRAAKAREEMDKQSTEKEYCTKCSPYENIAGMTVIGKGTMCPHMKYIAPKL
jgi:hypothetical protein